MRPAALELKRETKRVTSACAARAGRIRAACDDDDGADVDGIEEGEEDEGDGESDATRAAEEGDNRTARICVRESVRASVALRRRRSSGAFSI